MSILKSTFSSIGSAAGVAWPIFGIVSASLGLAGPMVVALGTGCGLLFVLVSIPVFYILYRNALEERNKIDEKLSRNLLLFLENSHAAYLNNYRANRTASPGHFLCSLLLAQADNEQNAIQIKFLEFINKKYPYFLQKYARYDLEQKKEWIGLIIKDFLISTNLDNELDLLDDLEVLKIAALGFIGTFGAVAGCSAGMMGVFVAMGLLAGFGAMPILGFLALAAAVLAGVCTAGISVHIALEKDKKSQLSKDFKKFNRDFVAEFDLTHYQAPQQGDSENEFDMYRAKLRKRIVNPARVKGGLFTAEDDNRDNVELQILEPAIQGASPLSIVASI
ncbi:hypothetical protein BN59_00817 [Legionella massiliensis]|uniref:Uncharacterized protein n=1 Tax=Legionella massiliensis TaxID=1034943 RepID=A0A078KXT5_9GAMM|nr:hypothetical protein [Legionella massiliensis]CDZ76543.1 hypothetical protein BN59_00817 [Legionella massiliensis]CEE12281.1 hypothetical protein BN1094_00817 [Legionella massiliensis]